MRVLKRLQQSLATELTQEEFNARAAKLAETHEALALEREIQKEQKADMKHRLEVLEKQRTELARVVRSKKEDRIVDVEWHADDRKAVVQLVRMDTGEVYETRPMQAAEKQLSLLEPEKPAGAASDVGVTGTITGTVTFTHPDTGLPVTMTLEELEKVSKKLQKAARAAQAQTKH